MELTIGQEYKRKELHDQFGGGRQSGISPSAKTDIIFIFSGESGEQFGYEDGWQEDGYYHYTGEGQVGDMQFARGNRALLHHTEEGKRILLMETTKKSYVRYQEELTCVDYYYFQTHDRDGNNRRAIRFVLEPLKQMSLVDEKAPAKDEPQRSARKYRKPDTTSRRGLVTSRVGQGWYRRAVLEKFQSKCAVTGSSIEEVLIASHIVPWRDANDEERLDVDNGVLLSPNIDALFDKHLISFDDAGALITNLSEPELSVLGVSLGIRIEVSEGMRKYLSRHRDELRG